MMLSMMTLLLFSHVQAQLPLSDDTPRLWPQPTTSPPHFDGNATSLTIPSAEIFTMRVMSNDNDNNNNISDILQHNIDYYRTLLFARTTTTTTTTTTDKPLLSLLINVAQDATINDYPHLGMDESYTLDIKSPNATLTAPTVWGAIRGLETFVQLFQMNGPTTTIRGGGQDFQIHDAPTFQW